MTRQETAKIMAVLRGAYPNYYRGMQPDDLMAVVNLWHEMFTDEPYELVAGAVKRLIASDTKGFPPVIGQVKEQIACLMQPERMTEAEAWAIVRKAVRHQPDAAREQFDKLPDVLKRIVGSPSQLRSWAVMDEDTLNSVAASNFMRSYRVRAETLWEQAKLPKALRQAVADVSGLLSLEGANG